MVTAKSHLKFRNWCFSLARSALDPLGGLNDTQGDPSAANLQVMLPTHPRYPAAKKEADPRTQWAFCPHLPLLTPFLNWRRDPWDGFHTGFVGGQYFPLQEQKSKLFIN